MVKNFTAGILCYSVHDQNLYLLLGREQFVSGWLCSHQWSEPGGHAKKIDEGDPAKTALREFQEESLGVLSEMGALMEQKQYSYALQLFRQQRKRARTYYLVHQPYNAGIQTEFHVRREQLRGIQYTLHRLQNIQKQLLQLHAPTPEHPRRIHDRLQVVLDIVGLQEMDDHTFRVQVTCICPIDKVYFRYPRMQDGFVVSEATLEVADATAPVYTRLLNLRQLLTKQLVALPAYLRENAIAYPEAPVWLPSVRREFLEKDRLEWVPAADVLRQTEGWCRPTFVLPLQLMVAQLTRPKIPIMSETKNGPHRRYSVSPKSVAIADTAENSDTKAPVRPYRDRGTRGAAAV